MTIKPLSFVAHALERTETAIRKAARAGRFGDAAHRGPRGEWLFEWPRARELFLAKTDATRLHARHLVAMRPATDPGLIAAVNAEALTYLGELLARALEAPDLDETDRATLEELFARARAEWA